MTNQVLTLWDARADVTLTTYLLDAATDSGARRSRPSILICPGGGYEYCSEREAEPVALRFAGMGYHTFVLRYSVTRTAPTAEATRYPAALLDIAKAMAVLRENAEAWQLDPDRIAVCGFSAGAHVCASLATHWQDALLSSELGVPAEQLRPNAALIIYGVTNYVEQARYLAATGMDAHGDAVSMALTGKARLTEEEQRSISPVYAVTGDCPPVFLAHASNDFLVPVENALTMALALTKACVPYELHVFETGSHGFSLGDETTSSMDFELQPVSAGWVDLAKSWLKQHLPLTVAHGDGAIPTRSDFPMVP